VIRIAESGLHMSSNETAVMVHIPPLFSKALVLKKKNRIVLFTRRLFTTRPRAQGNCTTEMVKKRWEGGNGGGLGLQEEKRIQ
jgi:hypothetical protein